MKTLFLCALSLLAITTPSLGFTTHIEQTSLHNPVTNAQFDANALVKLLEEYTHFTKTEPQNISEDCTISKLIEGLSAQSHQLETEIQTNKTTYEGATPKNIETKLRQYYDSVKIALKELHKRQQRVRILAQNLLSHEHEITHIAFRENRLDSRILPVAQRLRDSLLQSPLVSSC